MFSALVLLIVGLGVGLGIGYTNQPLPGPPPNCTGCIYVPTALANNLSLVAGNIINIPDDATFVTGGIALLNKGATLQNLDYDNSTYDVFVYGTAESTHLGGEIRAELDRLSSCPCDIVISSVAIHTNLVIGPKGIYCITGELSFSESTRGLVIDMTYTGYMDFIQIRITNTGMINLADPNNVTIIMNDTSQASHLNWVVQSGGRLAATSTGLNQFAGNIIADFNTTVLLNDIEIVTNLYTLGTASIPWTTIDGTTGCWSPSQNSTLLPCPGPNC
jgi:hypothetical protein